MLITDNFRQQFYDIVKKEHVLLIVGEDVDALCAATILTHLFMCDDVVFSLVPVNGWESLDKTLKEHHERTSYIVLVNCGGNKPLCEFQLPPESEIFVIDSRRPFDVDNVFDKEKIRILVDSQELNEMKIPHVTEIYREDEESDDSEEESEEGGGNRMEAIERRILKKEQIRRWEKKKNDLLWEYYENTWHSIPSAVRMLELAADLNRATAELMWLAACGLNSQYVDRLVTMDAYTAICIDKMRPFIHKFAPRGVAKADDLLRISFEKELPIAMYSHWSLYRAMMLNEHFACKTKNWTQKGDHDVKHLLAGLGLTLNETKQKFEALDSERKKEIAAILEKEMDSSFASFIAHFGYCNKVNSADVARAVAAKLETCKSDSLVERFHNARSVVMGLVEGRGQIAPLQKSFELYKLGLESVWQLVSAAINQSEVLPMGPYFLYTCSRILDDDILESRHFIFNFQYFLIRAFNVSNKRKGRAGRPLVVAFPMTGDNQGYHLVTGCMPLNTVYADHHQKSIIGRAFDRVTKKNIRMKQDHFDSNIIILKSEDRSRFFDCLQTVLETAE